MSRSGQPPDLKKYMDKKLQIKMNANRMIIGTLRGFDQFMNLVVDNTVEVNGNEKTDIGMVVIRGNSGLSLLLNVVVLELGWTSINDLFSVWVAGLLEKCPHLKKLIIYGVLSEVKTHENCQTFAKFTESILQLGRKYMQVMIEFEYE
ncbi:hypothetical protein K1719_006741 [Acacia pycnantha]|nr:hypothetical protein K1719_006741 [Acacia pycnantha]